MKPAILGLIAIVCAPSITLARPVSEDIEELNLKAELAFADLGDIATSNFSFRTVEIVDGKQKSILGQILHIKSGLVCEFDANEELSLKVFTTNSSGEIIDFSCGIEGYGYSKNVYGYLKSGSIDEQLTAAKIAIEYRFNGALPYEIPISDFQDLKNKVDYSIAENFVKSRFAAYDVDVNDKRLITSVWIYETGDWLYKMRYSIEKDKNKAAINYWNRILNQSLGVK